MRKDTFVGGAVLGIVLAGIIGYAVLRPESAQAPTPVDTSWLPAEKYEEHAAYYDIEAYYATSTPLLATAGKAADAAAVASIRSFVSETIAQFKEDGDFADLTEKEAQMMGVGEDRKASLRILYLIAPAPHTVSYIFTIYADTLGAHGNMFFKTFPFDSSAGELLSLGDLFASRTPYLEMLSTMSRALLPDVIGEAADARMIASGTAPEEENFSNFFLDNQNLVLLFPPYQVAPYAAGPQTLRIPLSDLSSILKPEYR